MFAARTDIQTIVAYCSRALITQIDEVFQADAYLPNFDNAPGWSKTYVGEWQESTSGVRFRYVDYSKTGDSSVS